MSATTTDPTLARPGWFARAENWLDAKGQGAWIAAVVLGFILVWPVGLALLAYAIWSKRMFCRNRTTMTPSPRHVAMSAVRPSGNRAFDAYKLETLRRLEDEQTAFEEFLERLREAKDKTEFDSFMGERAEKAASADESEKG